MAGLVAALASLGLGILPAAAQPAPPPASDAALSSAAESVYAAARPRLMQVRTLVTAAAGKQSSTGSAFLVSADGLAITNYHVVSQFALEPQTYRLEYTAVDGSTGGLTLLAIDIANDLALVRLDSAGGVDKRDRPFFAFDERALAGELPKGERLYSMGNPLDLGFTIVEGTYNGPVERSYAERIHFSGAINPGMSGGPTVTAESRIAGINVAKQLGGDLVSFLVPARFAARLLERAQDRAPPAPADFHAEIGRQLMEWQAALYQSVDAAGFRARQFGPYEAPESAAPWFTCWAQTNAGQVPKPRASLNQTSCNSDTALFIAGDLGTGGIRLSNAYIRSVDLNQLQFAAFVSQLSQGALGGFNRRWRTPQRCHEDFLAVGEGDDHPPLRAVWCARAYREFEGLYDVSITAVTEDNGLEALVSRLSVQGIAYDTGIALAQRFLEAVKWTK